MSEEILEETQNSEENGALAGEAVNIDPSALKELVEAGVLYGRKKTKTHPRMQPYIFTSRNTVQIIDVAKTLEFLEKAQEFLKDIVRKDGLLMFVGTTPAARDLVTGLAKKFGYPLASERWLGGTLTNFKTIRQRVQYYLKLKSDQETGALQKYTKKERIKFHKEIERLTKLFSGLELLTRRPDAIVVVDAPSHDTAIREARRLKIPIVALASTDTDPDDIDYLIPGNDRARSSIKWVLSRLEAAIALAKEEAKTASKSEPENFPEAGAETKVELAEKKN